MLLPLDAPIGESQKMPEFTAFHAMRERQASEKRRFLGFICDSGTEIAPELRIEADTAMIRTPYFTG
jgi:hypothetical protein